MILSTIPWRALACALSIGAVALPAQKTKAARGGAPAAAAPVPAVLTQRAKLEKIIHQKVLRERSRGDRRREPRRAARDGRDGCAQRLVHADARVRRARAPVRAHVLQGNKDYPEPEQFIDRASELGAVFNGTTQEEVVNYYLTVPADSLDGGMRFLALGAPLAAVPRGRAGARARGRDRRIRSPGIEPVLQARRADGTRALDHRVEPQEHDRRSRHRAHHDAREDADDPAALLRAEQHGADRRRRRESRLACSASPRASPGRHGRVARIRSSRIPSRRFRRSRANNAVIVEQPVNTVAVIVQWQGPSVGKDPDATYAADVFSDVLNQDRLAFQRRLVDSGLWHSHSRELLHAQPHRADHDQRRDDARQAAPCPRRAR